MNLNEFLVAELMTAHSILDGVINDLSAEMLAVSSQGTANPIGATLAHVIGSEDRMIHALFQGKPTEWERGGWGAKLGMAAQPRQWDELKSLAIDLPAFRGYIQAVSASAKAYFATVSEADLERTVPFNGRDMKVGQIAGLMLFHLGLHAGEIAAHKGIQGAKGLPF
ncbi:MAG: DinB family protein [Chloroflexi bacterium]|nr:DinB family protein [Chloroflexota bacterium]